MSALKKMWGTLQAVRQCLPNAARCEVWVAIPGPGSYIYIHTCNNYMMICTYIYIVYIISIVSIYLPTYLSIFLSIYLSVHGSVLFIVECFKSALTIPNMFSTYIHICICFEWTWNYISQFFHILIQKHGSVIKLLW